MRGRLAAVAMAPVLLSGGCKRRHVPVDSVPELGYPACAGDAPDNAASSTAAAPVRDGDLGVVVARARIRSGPFSTEKNVVEQFELRQTSCGYTFDGRQEWPLAIGDIEVHYDANLSPLWAWKRMTIAGSRRADGNADTRRYELRTGTVFIKRRDAGGRLTLEKLLPRARMD